MKLLGVLILLMSAAAVAFTQPKGSGKKNIPIPTLTAIDVLASGSNGGMEKPFIFVARSSETYAALRKMVENLPEKVDFSKNAVVAAFLGTKPTGGYDVGLSADILDDPYIGAKLSVSAINPPLGRPVTDALTSPFKIVMIPVDKDKTLKVEAGTEWKSSAEVYKVVSGSLDTRGGINYAAATIPVNGTISIWRNADMVTCSFNLSGKRRMQQVSLEETASGSISKDGLLKVPRLDSGSFIRKPRYPLKATGKLSADKMSIEFATRTASSPQIRENSEGYGKIEFVKQK